MTEVLRWHQRTHSRSRRACARRSGTRPAGLSAQYADRQPWVVVVDRVVRFDREAKHPGPVRQGTLLSVARRSRACWPGTQVKVSTDDEVQKDIRRTSSVVTRHNGLPAGRQRIEVAECRPYDRCPRYIGRKRRPVVVDRVPVEFSPCCDIERRAGPCRQEFLDLNTPGRRPLKATTVTPGPVGR